MGQGVLTRPCTAYHSVQRPATPPQVVVGSLLCAGPTDAEMQGPPAAEGACRRVRKVHGGEVFEVLRNSGVGTVRGKPSLAGRTETGLEGRGGPSGRGVSDHEEACSSQKAFIRGRGKEIIKKDLLRQLHAGP